MFLGFGSPKGVTKIAPKEAKEKMQNTDTLLLDVRTLEEFRQVHIPGAKLIPLDQLSTRCNVDLTDKNQEIIVYCHSGARSAQAARFLASNGYTNILDMGGIMSWPYETQRSRAV